MARAPFQVLVLPYRIADARLRVAVFHRADYSLWQFVSGGGEDAETPQRAAARELQEEAGVTATSLVRLQSMTMIPGCWFSAWSSWPTSTLLIPEHAFAADVGNQSIAIGHEHTEFAWLEVPAAMERLRFDSNKNALWELGERVAPGPRTKRPAYR